MAPKWLSTDNILMQLESVKNVERGKGPNKKRESGLKELEEKEHFLEIAILANT